MNAVTPFPNQGEIIRYLANAFDLKASKKKLDEYARQGDTDYRLRDQLIDDVFTQPLRKLLDAATANKITFILHEVLNDYIQIVNSTSAECITRENVLSILAVNFIGPKMIWALREYLQPFGLSAESLFKSKQSTIDIVLNWFDKNLSQWPEFYQKLDKEHKNQLAVWRKNKALPQLSSIKVLPNWLAKFKFDSKTAHTIIALLVIARGLDWSRKGRIVCNDERASYESKFGAHFTEHQVQWYGDWSPKVDKLFKRLCLSKEKSSADKEYTREVLDKLTQEFEREIPSERLGYNLYWLEARWYLYSGELKTSLKYYKKAFEFSLYTAGSEQQSLFKEACVVSAKAKDRTFMKRLKNQAIVFDWLEPPSKVKQDNVNNRKSRSKNNIVEDWEVERWHSGFNQMFPQSCMFPGCEIDRTISRLGMLLSTFEDIDKVKPDFRNPNRVIKFASWQKKTPQLVFFIEQNKLNYAQQLLEKGASVNVFSEGGDTPILLALKNMDVTEIPFSEPDERYFNLVAAHEHEPEIINMLTSKKKLLPLICAVETGRPEVVKKVLELGADIERRGGADELTALYLSVSLAGRIDDPTRFKNVMKGLKETNNPRLLDLMQRTNNMGLTKEDTARLLQSSKNDKTELMIMETIEKLYLEREQLLSPTELRKIAKMLLDAGADPNAEHYLNAIEGYTPLMLAAENDEIEIFEEMVEFGGDPLKSCLLLPKRFNNNCFHIAFNWKSFKVLEFLSKKFPHDFDRFVIRPLKKF